MKKQATANNHKIATTTDKAKKPKFIYWFAYYNYDSPSVRYRAKYPLEYFKEKYGINNYLVTPGYSPSRIASFAIAYLSALLNLHKNSLIVIQRVNSNFIYSNLLKLLVKIRKHNTVYDLDDADYLENNSKTLYYFAKNCKFISAGSKLIADQLSYLNNNIIHSSSPISDLGIVKNKRNDLFTIGWIGGFGGEHKESLVKLIFPALKELDFNFRFFLLGANDNNSTYVRKYFSNFENIKVEIPLNVDWKNEVLIQKTVSSFDIGIATLINSEMQKSKSGIKAKQYMNNGVPVLSTNLPENNSVIIHGKNGFFCSNTKEFKERLIEFHNMSDDDYEYYSKNAKSSVEKFNYDFYLINLFETTTSYT